jgi:hypothetical protein
VPQHRTLSPQELAEWLASHADTSAGTVERSSDKSLSLSSTLVRATWRGRHTVAVSSSASAVVQVGAVTDLLAWHLARAGDPVDPDVVTLLLPETTSTEVRDAARTLRDSLHDGVAVEILIQDEDANDIAFELDDVAAPDYADSDRASSWMTMLAAWSVAEPKGAALQLAESVADDSLRLYPMLSQWRDLRWSVRIDGLEVGRVTEFGGELNVGRDGPTGARSLARSKWVEVWGAKPLRFGAKASDDSHPVATAAQTVRALIEIMRDSSGELQHGQPEHRLESGVLRGLVPVRVAGHDLELAFPDPLVSRGSQFPTLWGAGGSVRYLDALLRQGGVPWAVELKVFGGGGSGAYYRHGLAQAVLYRHFIRTAAPVHPWFERAGMDASACEACLALPRAMAPSVTQRIEMLRRLGERFGVPVVELDLEAEAVPSALADVADEADIEPGDTVIELRADPDGTMVPHMYTAGEEAEPEVGPDRATRGVREPEDAVVLAIASADADLSPCDQPSS